MNQEKKQSQTNNATNNTPLSQLSQERATKSNAIEIPSISLPKGGGALMKNFKSILSRTLILFQFLNNILKEKLKKHFKTFARDAKFWQLRKHTINELARVKHRH